MARAKVDPSARRSSSAGGRRHQPKATADEGDPGNAFERVRAVVLRIPKGRVMTYGEVAAAAGMPGAARVVGYALRSLGKDVPWQRVLGRRNVKTGHVTLRDPHGQAEQRRLLEREGVRFSASGGVELGLFGWQPVGVRQRRPRKSAAKP